MRRPLYIALLLMAVCACQKEIDFDYHEVAPVVTIEGRVTNEDVYVLITRTRSMDDSVRSRGISGATVTVSTEGHVEQLVYNPADGRYHSPSGMKGQAQQTYRMTVELDGRHYEAESTMPLPAPITSAKFVWYSVLDTKLLIYEIWADDPEPDVRGYYWYRMDRWAVDPEVRRKQAGDPYRWNAFDDRGSLGGRVYRDIHCMMEQTDDEAPDEDRLKSLLFDGDTITLQLMTIDRAVFDYYQSLSAGQSMGANPVSNIKGGCLGYFAAGSVTHADTIIYKETR